jgi:alkanesulfonate monooxygenase SsuD/methylene tetrahydromethanopterin reductase-like flavin-dependent oxidoreductase (luciferase family)
MARFVYWIRQGFEINEILKQAYLAEESGFDSICYGDRVIFPRNITVYDCWTILTAIACNTRKLLVGPCVTEPHRRHPAQTAQIAATLDHVSNGRTFMMIGAGEKINLENFGIDFESPAEKLKEAVWVIRSLFNSSFDKPVSYAGKFFKLNNAFLQVKPKQKTLPVYIAANSKKTRRIAVELGDGWISFLETPKTLAKNVAEIRKMLKSYNRRTEDFSIFSIIPIAASKNREYAKSLLERVKYVLAWIPEKLAEAGFDLDIPPELSLTGMRISERLVKLNEEVAKRISFDVADAFTVWGTPDDCIDRLKEYINAGADSFVFYSLDLDFNNFIRIAGQEIIPQLRELMG